MQSTVNGRSIQTIIEMDKKARQRVMDAVKQAEEISAQADEQKKKLLSDYRKHSESKIEAAEQSFRAESEKKTAEINAERDRRISEFDKIMDGNREKLKDSIFQSVTGCERRH